VQAAEARDAGWPSGSKARQRTACQAVLEVGHRGLTPPLAIAAIASNRDTHLMLKATMTRSPTLRCFTSGPA
jgi:hypothetical protein